MSNILTKSTAHEVDDHEISSILHSLKVLSAIKENDKVCTRKGIYLHKCDSGRSVLQPFSRWMYSEDRKSNLSAIDAIFSRAVDCCCNLLKIREELKESDSVQVLLSLIENKQMIKRLQAEMNNALKGVRHLSVTYVSDSHSMATIALLDDTVTDRLERINIHMANLSEQE